MLQLKKTLNIAMVIKKGRRKMGNEAPYQMEETRRRPAS
jgi:hypothetical protein